MKLYKCRQLMAVPLLIFGLFIIAGGSVAEAAMLKDVRIGEYKGFTRVVFELNAPGDPPHIQPQSHGVLTIGFDDTHPDLIRKIPVERSEHVREMKFWHRKDRLSVTLQFDFDHFRFETFPLEQPPRIALDIHPLTTKPMVEDEIVPAPDQTPDPAPASATTQPADNANQATEPPVVEFQETEPPSQTPPQREVSDDQPMQPPAAADTDGTEPTLVSSTTAPDGGLAEKSRPASNRLQFYLVIVLVVITIVILALLLLMLLARHRWAGDKNGSDVKAYLKNQDQRIASLNARIQEQFKRYEEA